MSTNSKRTDEEVKLERKNKENYSPEIETSIWYN